MTAAVGRNRRDVPRSMRSINGTEPVLDQARRGPTRFPSPRFVVGARTIALRSEARIVGSESINAPADEPGGAGGKIFDARLADATQRIGSNVGQIELFVGKGTGKLSACHSIRTQMQNAIGPSALPRGLYTMSIVCNCRTGIPT